MQIRFDRFPRYNALIALVLIVIAVLLFNKNGIELTAFIVTCAIALAGFLYSPLQRVTIDTTTRKLHYFWLFLIKKTIELEEIEDWDGHTTSTSQYKNGKRSTSYTHTMTVYTKDGESYSFQVYSRPKMKEFDIKLNNALAECGLLDG